MSGQLYSRVFALDDISIRSDGDGRTVTAYAAVFNSPAQIADQDGHYSEQIAPNAFTKTLQERAGRIGVFYNHAMTLHGSPSERGSIPIGKPLDIRADGRGLLTVTRYNKTPLADEVLESIRNGDITGQSFTGRFIKSDPAGPYRPSRSGDLPLVTRHEIALIEYGPTPIPAYADAAIVGVRTLADFEDASARTANAVHHTPVVDEPWDGPAAVAAMPAEYATLHYCHAWQSAAADASSHTPGDHDVDDQKGQFKFPHHKALNGPANVAACRDGLSRLANADIPDTDRAGVRAHLEAHLDDWRKNHGGSSSGSATTDTDAAMGTSAAGRAATETNSTATTTTEPHAHSAASPTTRTGHDMPPVDTRMSIEERAARQSEIRARLSEIDTEFSGAELPEQIRSEWNALEREHGEHQRAIVDQQRRAERLRALADNPAATERVDNDAAGYVPNAPAFVQQRTAGDIFDLTSARNEARSVEDLGAIYRTRAMRAIELAPMRGAPNRQEAQTRAAELLDRVDDEHGTLAKRMLTTGSPTYERAFGKMTGRLSVNGLSGEERRALELGVDASGGYAVPFQLDPTVILTSPGVVNPLRQVARVVQIVGKAWEGVTSAGITVTRSAEGAEASDNSPTLAQPAVETQRVTGFVPFTVEIERSWSELGAEVTMMLQDAKDTEEAGSFTNGNGTAPAAGGLIGTLPAGSKVAADTVGGITVPEDIEALENALSPRWRANAKFLAARQTYNLIRGAASANQAYVGDIWIRLSGGLPPQLNGYDAYELSAMPTLAASGGGSNLLLAFGDYQQFLIVDRIGMSVELVPHLFGSNGRPTGQRGIYAYWSNNSAILVPDAIRVLNVTSNT